LNGDNGQASKKRAQQVIGTHEDPTVKPCVIDDRLERVAEDVTDGVATFQVSSSEGITLEQDLNEELERKLQTSNPKSHGNGKVVKIERSAKQDGVKEIEISRNERERAMRQQERERIEKAKATARVSTDGESTTVQPSLPNGDSGTDSLATLEKRVAESCSLVERVLKEREEKDKAINEGEREQRKERSKGELQQQERNEREPWETMQRNANREGTSTGSEEEAPSQHTTSPEKSQWLCEHYQRLCRVKFPCCGRFYPCHRCHNNSEECEKDNCKANEAFYMECSVCSHQQAVS